MAIAVTGTTLEGVLQIDRRAHQDRRGYFLELYERGAFEAAGIALSFVEDDVSVSTKGVLRGLHGNQVTHKLVSCVFGRVFVVVADCREGRPSFGQWASFDLSDENHRALLIPPGFGTGHLALSDKVIFHYKQSTSYDPKSQFTYHWDDPRFAIRWPLAGEPVLSDRDG